jgi:membrane protease YdiL (CAAX protease family)
LGVAGVLAPAAEELFFRGALYARLCAGRTPLAAGLAAGLCFTLGHLDVRAWLPLLPVAGALALLRAASRGILPCFLLHAAFNATTLGVAFSSAVQELARGRPAPTRALLGSLVCLALGALLARRLRRAGSSP